MIHNLLIAIHYLAIFLLLYKDWVTGLAVIMVLITERSLDTTAFRVERLEYLVEGKIKDIE